LPLLWIGTSNPLTEANVDNLCFQHGRVTFTGLGFVDSPV